MLPFCDKLCYRIAVCGLVWQYVALYDLLWAFTVYVSPFHGLGLPYYGLVVWRFYGRLWHNIDFIGLVSSFLAVIDPNSFGLVYNERKKDHQQIKVKME